jgi:uracil-DNA glycosylase
MAGIEHRGDATPLLPTRKTLKSLRESAAGCRGCHLYAPATQTVFGEGMKRAKVMMVGEMPGDREDRARHPFVGTRGQVRQVPPRRRLPAPAAHRPRATPNGLLA